MTAHTRTRLNTRRAPTVTSKAKATFRHSNQRHGNCTNRSLGRYCQRIKLKEYINSVAAAAQAISVHQVSGCCVRHLRENHATPANMIISVVAIIDTSRLKRLWSASLMIVKRKLSCGRTPGASTSAMFTHFSSYAAV